MTHLLLVLFDGSQIGSHLSDLFLVHGDLILHVLRVYRSQVLRRVLGERFWILAVKDM